MVILVTGTYKQLSIFKSAMRERVSFIWYPYDFIPKQVLEYVNIDPDSTDVKDKKLIRDIENALDNHSDICFRDCMTVISDYLENPTSDFLIIPITVSKIIKFKGLECKRIKIINDPNLVSGSLEHEKHSLYDYALYNAHDKKTMKRKVAELVRWLEKAKFKGVESHVKI